MPVLLVRAGGRLVGCVAAPDLFIYFSDFCFVLCLSLSSAFCVAESRTTGCGASSWCVFSMIECVCFRARLTLRIWLWVSGAFFLINTSPEYKYLHICFVYQAVNQKQPVNRSHFAVGVGRRCFGWVCGASAPFASVL